MSSNEHDGGALVRRAAASTVASLFAARAAIHGARTAIDDGAREQRQRPHLCGILPALLRRSDGRCRQS